MGLFNFMDSGATGDINQGTDQANGYLNPYYQGGTDAFNQYRQYANNFGNNINQYQNPGSYQYGQINQAPSQYYQNIMNSYQESPEAHYAQQQAMRASNQGASASGMLGSGAFQKEIMNNANDISQRDRQQYYGNVMGANQAQMGYLQNLQGQQGEYRNMMNNLSNYGYGAAGQMSANDMERARMQMQQDNQNQNNAFSLGGMIGGSQGFSNLFPTVASFL